VIERKVIEGGLEKFVLGEYSFITYAEYFGRINNLGAGLAALPEVTPGAKLVIYADTQLLWMLSAFASWRQGCVVGTIYATLGEEGALFGINQSECPIVFADGKLLKILGAIASKCTKLKRVVVFKEEDVDGEAAAACKAAGIEVTPLATLENSGAENPRDATPSAKEDTAVLMYTSGTTGNPKGVLLSHEAVCSMVCATKSKGGELSPYMKPGYRYMAYLPLAHIMELAVEVALFSTG
jgi:long-chain acyl-CoA synthetase